MIKKLFLPALLLVLLTLAFTAQAVCDPGAGWCPPTTSPPYPAGSVPLNTGSVGQTKSGWLNLGSESTTGLLASDFQTGGLGLFFSGLGVRGGNFLLATSTPALGKVLMSTDNFGIASWVATSTLGLGGGGGASTYRYLGATPGTYNGAQVQGYAGGDQKCQDAFPTTPGVRMATAADFANGRPTEDGWFNTFTRSGYVNVSDVIWDCQGWLSSNSSLQGTRFAPLSQVPYPQFCNNSSKILCSAPLASAGPGGLTGLGTTGQAAFWTNSNTLGGNPNFFWDNTNSRLGIGTMNPSAKLDVTGQVKIADGTQGTGKVLTSDASGLASWSAVAGNSVMYLKRPTSNSFYCSTTDSPALCPSATGWLQVDLQGVIAGANQDAGGWLGPTSNCVRTCYQPNKSCQVMRLEKQGNASLLCATTAPALCPDGWSEAGFDRENAGGIPPVGSPPLNCVRTCYRCAP